jgi:hypothetical protein
MKPLTTKLVYQSGKGLFKNIFKSVGKKSTNGDKQ